MAFIRPVMDYVRSAFHFTLTNDQAEELVRIQRRCLKSIYGTEKSYSECLELSGLERLTERRERILESFTERA